MAEEADAALLDSLGVSNATLFPTQGALAAEKILDILSSFTSSSLNAATKAGLAEGWSMWAICTDATLRATTVSQHVDKIYDVITSLGLTDDDAETKTDGDYKGALFVAFKIADSMKTVGTMDPTQQLTSSFCPRAYKALQTILAAKPKMSAKTPMQSKDSAATYRGDLCCSLVRTLPYSGTVDLPIGLKVISTILLDKAIPDRVKSDAKAALNTIGTVAKSSIVHGGADIMALVQAGGNDQLLMNFVSVPELYSNNPAAVHDNLVNVFFKQTYMMYCSLYFRIAQANPAVLVPHVAYFIANLASCQNMATVTLMTLDGIATVDANAVYSNLDSIIRDSKSVPNGGSILAKLLGNLGTASTAGAAETVLTHLTNILSHDASAAASVLAAVSNVMKSLSDVDALKKLLPVIEKHKAASEVAFTAISDFAAGRSLETLTTRVDELDARVKALNNKVAETCSNMAEVIAYVDANMADMKDFIAEVAKKLPAPKRLEVVGTLRKTLILHFECVHTGLEFPIVSHEWSKWLKMGFSLVKAGQAVIDLGMGNPLGILKKGVECVQEIYGAYKTNDDDEFNTYITQPFLTSKEQDMLLEKLRDQGFFDVFAYDAQVPGWYLLHPEKDGKTAGGDTGSVSKVRTKEGYGIGETVAAIAKEAVGAIAGDAAGLINPLIDAASGVELATVGTTSSTGDSVKQGQKSAGSGSGGGASGGRAAAMKEQFGNSVNAQADAKLESASKSASYYGKVDDMEKKIRELEDKVRTLTTDVHELRDKSTSSCCVIS